MNQNNVSRYICDHIRFSHFDNKIHTAVAKKIMKEELITRHQEEKRKRHTSSRTTQILLGPLATRKHKAGELAGSSLRRIMIHTALLVDGFSVEMLPLHLPPLVALSSLS
jgi:hypothetical protein